MPSCNQDKVELASGSGYVIITYKINQTDYHEQYIIRLCLNLSFFRDPNLWMARCQIGEEKATVIQLMRKFIALSFQDEVTNYSLF